GLATPDLPSPDTDGPLRGASPPPVSRQRHTARLLLANGLSSGADVPQKCLAQRGSEVLDLGGPNDAPLLVTGAVDGQPQVTRRAGLLSASGFRRATEQVPPGGGLLRLRAGRGECGDRSRPHDVADHRSPFFPPPPLRVQRAKRELYSAQ